jgi:hypothetical protein
MGDAPMQIVLNSFLPTALRRLLLITERSVRRERPGIIPRSTTGRFNPAPSLCGHLRPLFGE